MVNELAKANAESLSCELTWYADLLKARIDYHFAGPDKAEFKMPPAPDLSKQMSPYAKFVRHYGMTDTERLTLLTALVPHIRPELFDIFFLKNEATDRGFSEFGGLRGQQHGGLLPTGETVLFLTAGGDLAQRFTLQYLFDGNHYFARHGILHLEGAPGHEPYLAGHLSIARTFLDYFTIGEVSAPPFGPEFPARKLESTETWADLVLDPSAHEQVEEIKLWLRFGPTVMDDLGFGRRMKPGYRGLFYGPPGTGKSMTAALLGRDSGFDVYRIDLSMVVSKYIGETEKNLARVFDYAEHHSWILFFDEADALFGKRTATKDAHDRYANQETAYLLQRIEDYAGVAILATNQKDNIDEAFTRRFHAVVHFPLPAAPDRHRIWQRAFSELVELEDEIMLMAVAEAHEISGGAIMNIARFAGLRSAGRGDRRITRAALEAGVRRELRKEGRSL